jgi:hypothetical protein
MRILIYEPAFSIIGDPTNAIPKLGKARPLDGHIIATLLQGVRSPPPGWDGQNGWQQLMLRRPTMRKTTRLYSIR